MINNKLFWLSIISILTIQLSAQQLNTPKEFEELMKVSPIEYFQEKGSPLHRYKILESPVFTAQVSKVSGSRTLQKAIKKGNKHYKRKRWSKAFRCYEKALAIDNNNVWLLRRIGQVLLKQEEYTEAIIYLDKVLTVNSKDFEALMYKAECQSGLGNTGQATRTIALAHIYNRNDATITQKLIQIAALDGLIYNDNWKFPFNYNIKQIGEDSVQIQTPNPIWQSYANCKAVWQFDESYKRAKMNDFSKNVDFIQEKECLLNFLITYEAIDLQYRNKVKPLAPNLIKAVDSKMINAFIIYEVWAVENPTNTHELTDSEIDLLMMYIFTVRSNLVK